MGSSERSSTSWRPTSSRSRPPSARSWPTKQSLSAFGGCSRTDPVRTFGGPLRSLGRGAELEGSTDTADPLPDALLVLDECESHVIVPGLAETNAGRHRNLRLLDEELGELE